MNKHNCNNTRYHPQLNSLTYDFTQNRYSISESYYKYAYSYKRDTTANNKLGYVLR